MSPPATAVASLPPESPLERLAEVASAAGYPELGDEVRRVGSALARGALTIVVLGQFKRGKSSLLNAFAGERVFPTGLLPLTAVATRLVRGPRAVRVTERNGDAQSLPIDRVEEFVSERKNPGNRRGVAEVEISMPLPDWTEGVTFVDSPGIGSPHDANTAAARALLPHADAAIFVLSPDPSITSNEIEFLTEVSPHATKFFFVLNKSDLVAPDERDDLATYLREILERRCGFPNVRLFPVSAKLALEAAESGDAALRARSGLPTLWEEIHRFVGPERTDSVKRVVERRTQRYAERIQGLIDLAVTASQLSREEFTTRLRGLEEGIATVRSELRATQAMLREEVTTFSGRMQAEPSRRLEPRAAEVVAKLDRHLAETRGGTAGAAVHRFEAELQKEVRAVVDPARRALALEAQQELERIALEFESRLKRWLVDLGRRVAQEFGVELPELAVEGSLAASEQYSDRVERMYEGTMAGQTALLLPSGLLRRRLRSRLPRIVQEELDAQAGRLASDLVERLGKSWESLRSHAAEQLERDVRTLESALNEGQRRQAEGHGASATWSERMRELRQTLAAIEATAMPSPAAR